MEFSLVPVQVAASMSIYTKDDREDVNDSASDTQSYILDCQKAPRNTHHIGPKYNPNEFKVPDAAACAEKGCRGCRFIATLISGIFSVYTELEPGAVSLKWISAGFTLRVATKDDSIRTFQFFNIKGAQIRIAGMPGSHLLTGNTALPTSFNRARMFLQECEGTHAKCGSGRDVPLPKRLLNVTEITCSNGDTGIRLETTEDKIGTYVCLSHCWGDPSLIHTQTRTTTINNYHNFISWSALPKTFQDAVTLSRKLDVEYLWIDSLCIIQDSRADWEVESTKMGDIYRNSYITIAASASPGSSSGCFSETIPDSCLLITEPRHPDIYVGLRDCQGTGKMPQNYIDEAFTKHFPLFSRAWAYQERMLSRRILFCNRSEFQVGCQERLRCECGSGAIAPHFRPGPKGLNVAKLKTPSELKPSEGGGGLVMNDLAMVIYRNWVDVVESYAKLNLTKPSDKLPALSATASIIARNMGSDYLAGIWRVSLMEGLLWYVRGPLCKPRPMGEDWRAPSWSWASVDTPFGLGFIAPRDSFSPSFYNKIEVAECVPAGENRLGQVSSGFIRLKASLGRTFWRIRCRGCTTPTGRRATRGLPRADYTLYTDELHDTPSEGWVRCAFSEPALDLMGSNLGFFADALVDDSSKYGFFRCLGKGTCKLAPCYLLYVHRNEKQGGVRSLVEGHKRTNADAFLVLTKLQTQQDTFERIGLATISHDTEKKREEWFNQVWPSIVLSEKTINLV